MCLNAMPQIKIVEIFFCPIALSFPSERDLFMNPIISVKLLSFHELSCPSEDLVLKPKFSRLD